MDNEGFVAMIRDPQAKKVIYILLQTQEKMLNRIEQLENNKQPNNPIGFHMKGGEHTLETAFINKQHNIPD